MNSQLKGRDVFSEPLAAYLLSDTDAPDVRVVVMERRRAKPWPVGELNCDKEKIRHLPIYLFHCRRSQEQKQAEHK